MPLLRLLVCEKMQRSLEYYFNKPSSSDGAVPNESSEGTNTTKPVVLRIEPVGRPRKPSAKPATRQLVDYSSTDTEESTNESPPLKKSRIHRTACRKGGRGKVS